MKHRIDTHMDKTQTSRYVGLPLNSLREWIRRGKIQTEMVGRREMIAVSEVERVKSELEERRKIRIPPEQWCHMGCTY